jgi:ABC-type branched-subunit amino acid transport system substrate-binding protein
MSKHSAVIVGTTTTYGRSMSAEFKSSFEQFGGRVVDQVWVEEGAQDFEVIVDRMPKDLTWFFMAGPLKELHF